MSKSFTFYLPLALSDLTVLVESFQKEFDELIGDSFTDEELEQVERKLEALAAVYPGPVIEELTFEDFEAVDDLRPQFESSQSALVLENVPYLETNPFQVSWLQLILKKFGNFVVDRGGYAPLQGREAFEAELSLLPNIDELIQITPVKTVVKHGISAPVLPIDFLILDVYKEIQRLRELGLLTKALEMIADKEKQRKIFGIMKEGKLDGSSLLDLTRMGPKEFDDNLEKLKFSLRKIV